MPLRLRRGTDAERLAITPAVGEPVYTTDTKKLYIGDGTTAGGIEVTSDGSGGGIADIVSDTTPQLGGNLDLNSNNIIGTGNINIDGTITASGNINLGDSTEDSLNLTGLVNSNITPATNALYNIGSDTLRWNNVFGTNIFGDVNGNLVSNDSTILVNAQTKDIISRDIIATGTVTGLFEGDVQGSLIADDDTVLINAETKSISVNTIGAQLLEGNVQGSVNASDSSVLLDGINNLLYADVENTNINTGNISIGGPFGGISITTEGTIEDDYSLFSVTAYHSTSNPTGGVYVRGRGSELAPATIQAGDSIFHNLFLGITDTQPGLAAIIEVNADADGTINNNIVPGQIVLKTFNDAGDEVVGLSVNKDGEITVADNTLVAGAGSGDVDASAPVSYLQITVGGNTYAMPLFGINP